MLVASVGNFFGSISDPLYSSPFRISLTIYITCSYNLKESGSSKEALAKGEEFGQIVIFASYPALCIWNEIFF
jgi:hypothetical protein